MIKSFIEAAHLLPMINQEGNAQPGEGLTVLQTVTRFIGIPLLAFAIIGGLAWVSSAPKKAKKDVINEIEDDSEDSFITFIA